MVNNPIGSANSRRHIFQSLVEAAKVVLLFAVESDVGEGSLVENVQSPDR